MISDLVKTSLGAMSNANSTDTPPTTRSTREALPEAAAPDTRPARSRRRPLHPLDHRPTHVSFNLEVPLATREKIDEVGTLVGARGASEVVRRAVTLFAAFVEADRAGSKVIVRAADGSETRFLVF